MKSNFIFSDPYPSNGSLLTLFAQQAMPVALTINNTRANIPNIMITNSGSQRFDVYAGPFTKNDQLTASPFTDAFLFIPNVTAGVAKQVLPALNGQGAEERRREFVEMLDRRETELYKKGHVDMIYRKWLEEMDRRDGVERRTAKNLTLGYVTQDVSLNTCTPTSLQKADEDDLQACPGIGDDTLHAPMVRTYACFPDSGHDTDFVAALLRDTRLRRLRRPHCLR